MSALPFVFSNTHILFGLLALPAIWWLLRLTPPHPKAEVFPSLKILGMVLKHEETPSKSPLWLTLLRMTLDATVILALADPVVNPRNNRIAGSGPLVLVVDNGWASAIDWDRRMETVRALISDAERASRPVSISFTADAENDSVPSTTAVALEKLAAAKPKPLLPDRTRTAETINEALNGAMPGTLAYITDGVATAQDESALKTLASLSPTEFRILQGNGQKIAAITAAANNANAMSVTLSRLETAAPIQLIVNAQDSQEHILANGVADFAAGQAETTATVEAPFELRNDFGRLSIEGSSTAGAVHLLDEGFHRRRVALLAGETSNDFQPLLQPLYYISRALQPYVDLIPQKQSDLLQAIPEILQSNPSIIIMADIGRLPQETYEPLRRWLAAGGTLIRFAGPRLATAPADDPLVPVTLRQGERALGGALSWTEPQPLADFPTFGAFTGMPKADGVLVQRQVLAEPAPDLAERTWASLADGTPLVTNRTIEAGRIILFHVSAEVSWSDLPISGHFVEMLRRIVQLSNAGSASSASANAAALPPFRLLTAQGELSAEIGSARPLKMHPGQPPQSSLDNPPGFYGTENDFVAVNILSAGVTLRPLDLSDAGVYTASETLIGETAKSLRPAFFIAAFIMLIVDSFIVLFMNGAFARLTKLRSFTATAKLLIGLGALAAWPAPDARASDPKPGDEQIFQRLDTTHLAYVRTGEDDVDKISQQGLQGLGEFLTRRTPLEPGQPVDLDISTDELSFYPIIYWPMSATAPMPTSAAISRIDAYMRAGGTVLFDTRDQFSALDNSAISTNAERLQAILANIDIPPLEPVSEDHIMTRSFYLLTNFPGRYTGSPLWVESRRGIAKMTSGIYSSGDGVTPIIITGNDFAGAWAIDQQGAAVMPTVPPDELQRENSFRAGVNIIMYMLTGNYKADQIHVPALLKRLGQ